MKMMTKFKDNSFNLLRNWIDSSYSYYFILNQNDDYHGIFCVFVPIYFIIQIETSFNFHFKFIWLKSAHSGFFDIGHHRSVDLQHFILCSYHFFAFHLFSYYFLIIIFLFVLFTFILYFQYFFILSQLYCSILTFEQSLFLCFPWIFFHTSI